MMHKSDEVLTKILDFLGLERSSVNLQEDFLYAGIVDSFGLIQLLSYIQEEFGVSFSEDELEDKSLRTLEGLSQAVYRKLRS